MITIEVDQIRELEQALGDAKKRMPREIAIAINRTAKWTTTQMSRQVREQLNAKARDVKKVMSQKTKASPSRLGTKVELEHEKRLGLKAFGARQTRSGVTAKVSKRGPRTKVPGGFMGPRPGAIARKLGGHAFKRTGKGRKPIAKLHGASPWGAYVVNRMRPKTLRAAELELQKQIKRRIDFQILKRNRLK